MSGKTAISRITEGGLSLLSLLICLWLPWGAGGGEQKRGSALENYLRRLGYEPIPFNYDRDVPIMEGQLGTKSCVFMVDSGCPVTALDSTLAKGLKSPSELGVVLDDPILGAISNINHLVVLIDKLKLGKVEFRTQPAQPHTLEVDFVSTRYRCLIGLDFLRRNFCILDCAGRRLYVRDTKPSNEISNALAKTLLLSGLTNVPMRWDGDGHLLIDAEINGQPVRLLVDSGCGLSVLDQAEMKRLGLRPVTRMQVGSYIPDDDFNAKIIGVGKIGGHKLHFTKVDVLQIGDTQWKGLYMGTTDLSAWKNVDKHGEKRLHGAVGPGVLAPEGAVIDFAARKFWFPKEPPKRDNNRD